MKSQKILSLLEEFSPLGEEQSKQKDLMISFIKGNIRCFEADHPPVQGEEKESEMGHVTGSAWVLNPNKDAVLLTHHKKLNKWLQLGGHSDGEPNVIQTALREAREESGIEDVISLSEEIFDIDIHIFPEKNGNPAHLHYDVRFLLQAQNENFVVSEESHNLKWIPLAEITPDQFEESVYRMARKTREFF